MVEEIDYEKLYGIPRPIYTRYNKNIIKEPEEILPLKPFLTLYSKDFHERPSF